MLAKFLSPYVSALHGAAWNLQQNFEGLGLSSSSYLERNSAGQIVSSYWSPGEATLIYLGLLLLIWMILAALLLLCGYVLAGKPGAAGMLFVELIPGISNMAGAWPNIGFAPDEYVIDGTGVLGTGHGMAPLILIGVVSGWCLSVLAIDYARGRWRIGDRFWSAFDHVWYAAGLLAGIFFVADSQVALHTQELQNTSRQAQQSSAYLLKQVSAFDKWCRANHLSTRVSCLWATDVQQTLLDYSTSDARVFAPFGPVTSQDIYVGREMRTKVTDIDQIRREIASYNMELCPAKRINANISVSSHPSAQCQTTPAAFRTSVPEPLDGKVDKSGYFDTTALASEDIIPSLVTSRSQVEKQLSTSEQDRRSRHLRWAYYLLFSVVAGAKTSNATDKLFKLTKREDHEMRRGPHAARRFWDVVCAVVRFCFRSLAFALRVAAALLRKPIARKPRQIQHTDTVD